MTVVLPKRPPQHLLHRYQLISLLFQRIPHVLECDTTLREKVPQGHQCGHFHPEEDDHGGEDLEIISNVK